jgi:hypothetical protein
MSRTRSVSQTRFKKRHENGGQVPEVPPVPETDKLETNATASNQTPKAPVDKPNGHNDLETERRDTIDEPTGPSTSSRHSRFRLSKRTFSLPTSWWRPEDQQPVRWNPLSSI